MFGKYFCYNRNIMDDNQGQFSNTNGNSSNPNTNEDKKKQEYISVGGFSPEVVPASSETAPEQTSTVESGYERIKQIEKSAETREKKEVIHKLRKPVDDKKKQAKKVKKISKKYPSPLEKIKYFGYRPAREYLHNVDRIKKQVGKGDPGDTKTWLLVFLDRILRKEST